MLAKWDQNLSGHSWSIVYSMCVFPTNRIYIQLLPVIRIYAMERESSLIYVMARHFVVSYTVR